MRKDLNRVQLIGHVGGEPEKRYLSSGTCVTTFSVATNQRWTDAAGVPQIATEWSRVVAWDRLAEIAGDYLRTGRYVYVTGRLRTRAWQDPLGQTRYTTEVVAQDLILLDRRPQEAAPDGEPPPAIQDQPDPLDTAVQPQSPQVADAGAAEQEVVLDG